MDRLQALTPTECLDLLGRSSLGRVAFTERALPAIRPVNYALVGHQIVLQIDPQGLGRKLDGQVVAFEVDEIDSSAGTGWSVVVTGTARMLRAPGDLMRQASVPLVPLAGPAHDTRVCIVPGDISGRRIPPPPTPREAQPVSGTRQLTRVPAPGADTSSSAPPS